MPAASVTVLGLAIPLKYVSLGVLVVQTSAMVLVLRTSRTADELYISSTAVLLAEFVKLITCLFLVFKGWLYLYNDQRDLNDTYLKQKST